MKQSKYFDAQHYLMNKNKFPLEILVISCCYIFIINLSHYCLEKEIKQFRKLGSHIRKCFNNLPLTALKLLCFLNSELNGHHKRWGCRRYRYLHITFANPNRNRVRIFVKSSVNYDRSRWQNWQMNLLIFSGTPALS